MNEGKGLSSVPGHKKARDGQQGSKHLLFTRWLGQRSLTSQTELEVVILEGALSRESRNPKLRSLSQCPDSRWERVVTL